MWCECCKADVAAELSSDHRRFSCTRCGSELGHTVGSSSRPVMPRVADSERDARELLARWSAMSVFEPMPVPATSEIPGPTPASTVRIEPVRVIAAEATLQQERIAPTEPFAFPQIPTNSHSVGEAPSPLNARPRRRKARRSKSQPIDVATSHTVSAPPKSTWSQLAGHLAAYGGVGLLSVGMTLVIWSYFGGPPAYAPTGWLLTTVGQMLLYLGVVTLVASGLEQTTDAVTLQMRQMGDKLERLEAASRRERRATVSMRDAA